MGDDPSGVSAPTLRAIDELNRIDEAIRRAADAAGAAIERVRTGRMVLTLHFADRSMTVVNVQPFDGQPGPGFERLPERRKPTGNKP